LLLWLTSPKPWSLAYPSAQQRVFRTSAGHGLLPGGEEYPVHPSPISNAVINMSYLDYVSKLLKMHTVLRSKRT